MKDHAANCFTHRREFVSGNIFIRPAVLEKKGDFVQGHKHNFDHTTIFLAGVFLVSLVHPEGAREDREMIAPSYMLIKKDVEHRIEAISEDGGSFWCVYSHRDQQDEVVQEYNHQLASYG